ncbi:MAG: SprB repeat-containing protein, partial [Saprospiraceae bacterium]|nr:SprB repeat-containing protein [Saprospiraceae bacterium]
MSVYFGVNAPNCLMDCASATAVPICGNPPFSFQWSNGATWNTILDVQPGSYSVTVTDGTGQQATGTVVIPPAPPPVQATINASPSACTLPATLTASATGGTGAYTYVWSTGDTIPAIIVNTSGTYTVTVVDANEPTCRDTVSINVGSNVLAIQIIETPVTCFGDSTGSAAATVSGGTLPYTFSWSNGGNGASIGNLPAGSYILTVTDIAGCTAVDTAIITQPDTLVVTLVPDEINCASPLDTLTAVVTGGTGPYTYAWTPGMLSGPIQTTLAIGTYSVTVTDLVGCTASDTYTYTTPSGFDSIVVITTPSGIPEDSSGSATVIVFGGTAPYTYLWSNGGTTQTIDSLPAGTYCVTVTDINGCTDTSCGTVVQDTTPPPPPLTVDIVPAGDGICGDSLSKVMANAAGGTPPYTYLWSNDSTTVMIFAQVGDTVWVKVTDATGQMATDTIVVPFVPAVVIDSLITTNNACLGDTTGSATVYASGGTPPYTYAWTPNVGTGATVTGLGNGTYVVTVTDSLGCTVVDTAVIGSPDTLTVTLIPTELNCATPLDTLTAVVTGGTGPYTYAWTPGTLSGPVQIDLAVGTYSVTVTDAGGCTAVDTAIITVPDTLTVTLVPDELNCATPLDTLTAVVTGGTGPYTYAWTPGTLSGPVQIDLAVGAYSVTVTDAGGCTATDTYTYAVPVPIDSVVVTTTPTGIPDDSTGTATANVFGGTAPY